MNEWTQLLDRIVNRTPSGPPPPFVQNLSVPFPDGWERGRVWSVWEVDPRFFHERGAVFGGFIAVLADHVLGTVTMTVLESGETFSTSDLRVSFFRPVRGGKLRIEARVVYRGRSLAHVEVDFTRDDGKLAAKATATQVIAPPSKA